MTHSPMQNLAGEDQLSPRKIEDLTFTPSPEPTLGVELELQILDRETGDLAPGAVRILKSCAEDKIEGVTAELMQSMIEVKTGICCNVHDVRSQLFPILRRVRNITASLGFDLGLAGTHPFHRTCGSVLFPGERYERILDRLAWLAYQRVVFGLHVHVGVPSGDMALGVISMLVQYLPHLIGLSANSPFWQGVDTGLASSRVALYRLLPHAGVPRYFSKWKDFRAFCQVMQDAAAFRSFKDIYWDIRPRPDLGTIEFRICDAPPTLKDMLGLVALTRCLVISALRLLSDRPKLCRGDMRRHWIAVENRWLATRYGLQATFIRSPRGKKRLLEHDIADLLDKMMPIARESEDHIFLASFQPIDKFESGSDRQRQLYRETGTWKTLIEDMTRRLSQDLELPQPDQPGATP